MSQNLYIFFFRAGKHSGRNLIHTMSQHTFSSSNAVRDTELELVEDVNVSSLHACMHATEKKTMQSIVDVTLLTFLQHSTM